MATVYDVYESKERYAPPTRLDKLIFVSQTSATRWVEEELGATDTNPVWTVVGAIMSLGRFEIRPRQIGNPDPKAEAERRRVRELIMSED